MEWTLTRRRIDLGDVSLAVRDYRPERAGAPVVVLLHGVMCRGASWDRLARALCAAGHRVLAPDQRGHGRSSRPPALPENYRRAAYVGDLERLLDAAEIERCALIGHSTGGLNALVYAARHPDRVSALLVEDQAAEPRPSSHAEGWRTWLAEWPVPFSSLGAVREFFGAMRPCYADHFIELFEEAEDGWRPLFDPDAVAQTIAGNDAQPWWDELAAVECPALVVKGGESELALDEAERIARTLRRGSLLVVEPAGHVVHDDCPETFLAAALQLLGAADDAAIPRLVRRQYESGDARFEIDADRAALLLIDMQEEFVSPGGPFSVPEAARRVPAAARLLEACRERGLPVVHTAFSDTHRLLDRPRRGATMPNRFAGLDAGDRFRGAPRFASGLEPAAGEVVLLKPSYGAFADTPLETMLKNLGRDTVILAGTLTNYCVGATARQAYERGLAVVVASDACATDDAAAHDAELRVLRRGFARVLGTERILRELDRSTRAAAGAPAHPG